MRVISRNGFLIGMRDTGDQQHYLGLKVSEQPTDSVTFIQYNPKEKKVDPSIDEVFLAESVKIGIKKYNADKGTALAVTEIKYVPYDLPNYDVYTIMTEAILSKGL